jgi:hypothetical protein
MREIRDGKPILPEKFRANVPPALTNIMRRALARSRDDRYPDAAAMQGDLERYLKSSEALATSGELAAFLRRELPPMVGSDGDEATGKQEAGTENQSAGTEKQDVADTERQELADPEDVDDSQEDVDTAERDGPTQFRRPPVAFERPFSKTSLVPPLPHANRRAYVAAAVAAVTVAGVGLLALRPWRSQANPVIVVERPIPSPVVVPLPPPPPAPPPPAAPQLDIVSRPPGARVTIDRRALGTTPLRGHTLGEGAHAITVEKSGFQTRQLSVVVAPGEHRTLDVELRMTGKRGKRELKVSGGTLTVTTVPWSKVYDGNKLLGTTPLHNVRLSVGPHTLKFVNPEVPPVKRHVDVSAGEEIRLSLELK